MSRPRSVEEVVRKGLCSGCGLCESLAGRERIRMGISMRGQMRPYVAAPLPDDLHARILACCPGVAVRGPGRPRGVSVHPIWGPIRSLVRVWATDAHVRRRAATGGTLSALGMHLLDTGEVDAIVHVRASSRRPWLTDAVVSRTPAEVLSGAQSRYGPSSPLVHVGALLDAGERFAVIAKPCDISAVRALARSDPRVARQVRYLLTLFCGGPPSAHAAQAILRYLDIDESDVRLFRFRGEGWPGPLRVETHDRAHELPYPGAWRNRPYAYDVQFRCKVCPDAVGEVADLAVADAWLMGPDDQPRYDEADGVNLAITRTDAGERLLRDAIAAGCLATAPAAVAELRSMHANHPPRKLGGPAARLALRLARQAHVAAPGYRPAATLRAAGPALLWRQFTGTLRRVARRDNREPLI